MNYSLFIRPCMDEYMQILLTTDCLKIISILLIDLFFVKGLFSCLSIFYWDYC